MSIVKWLPTAIDDLKRLHAFIEPHSPQAAARAVDRLVEAAGALAEFPEKGQPWEPEPLFRELTVPFGARGYVIRYRIQADYVIVVRVWHGLENR